MSLPSPSVGPAGAMLNARSFSSVISSYRACRLGCTHEGMTTGGLHCLMASSVGLSRSSPKSAASDSARG
eukprot:9490990-Alexandrium_andersonii.AAC.1